MISSTVPITVVFEVPVVDVDEGIVTVVVVEDSVTVEEVGNIDALVGVDVLVSVDVAVNVDVVVSVNVVVCIGVVVSVEVASGEEQPMRLSVTKNVRRTRHRLFWLIFIYCLFLFMLNITSRNKVYACI